MAKRGRPKKSAYPRADKKKTEKSEASKWMEKINRALKVKAEWKKNFRVDLCYEYFEGRHRPAHIPEAEWITINLIYSTLRAELPALYSTDPYYYVKLKKSFSPKPEDVVLYETRGKIRQAMLNYLKGELNLKPKSRMSIFDAMFQFGVTKTLLKADRIPNPKKGQPIMGEDGRPSLSEDTGEPVMESDFLLENAEYAIERLHPDDFLVDEDAGPLEDSVKWMAHRIKRPLQEAKDDLSREKAYRDAIKPTEIHDEDEKTKEQRKKGSVYESGANKPEPDTVVEWEVYDLKNNQWLVVSEGCEYFGIEPEDVPGGTEKHPFSTLRFTMRDNSWYPIPPVSQLIDPQREYCERRSKLLVHAKRFNRKYEVYSQGLVDAKKAMTDLQFGDDGTMIESNTPAANTVRAIQDVPLDQQIHVELAYLRKDFDELAIGANQRGGTQGVDSATEAGILEKRTLIREGDAIGLVTDFLTDVGRKLDQLVQEHISQDMAVRVVGPEGEAWETVRQEDYKEIDGEYEYSIAVGSTTPQLPEIERTQWISFLGLIANAPQLLLSKRLLAQTAKLHHIEDEAMVEELFQIGQQMMSGQMPMPNATGSVAGTSGSPAARAGGGMGGVMNIRGGAA